MTVVNFGSGWLSGPVDLVRNNPSPGFGFGSGTVFFWIRSIDNFRIQYVARFRPHERGPIPVLFRGQFFGP